MDKWYWRMVWWSLTFDYKPGVKTWDKIKYFIWAVFSLFLVIPYYIFSVLGFLSEQMLLFCGWITDVIVGVKDDTRPKMDWSDEKTVEWYKNKAKQYK
jgi:hypothetical protein